MLCNGAMVDPYLKVQCQFSYVMGSNMRISAQSLNAIANE